MNGAVLPAFFPHLLKELSKDNNSQSWEQQVFKLPLFKDTRGHVMAISKPFRLCAVMVIVTLL